MKTKILLLFAIVSVLFVPCKNDTNGENEENYVALKWAIGSPYNIGWEAKFQEITLFSYSKTEWEIFYDPFTDWCATSAQNGTGRKDIPFTFGLNKTAEQRSIIVYARNINDDTEETVF